MDIAQRLIAYLDANPTTTFPRRLGYESAATLRASLATMAAQPDPQDLLNRIAALEQQLQAQQATDA